MQMTGHNISWSEGLVAFQRMHRLEEHEALMAVLQDFSFSENFLNFLDMFPNRAIKKEERRDCQFDVDSSTNFPPGFPASVDYKPKPRRPQFCRIATPYNQQFPLIPPRQGTCLNPFSYRKFIYLCCFFANCYCIKIVL